MGVSMRIDDYDNHKNELVSRISAMSEGDEQSNLLMLYFTILKLQDAEREIERQNLLIEKLIEVNKRNANSVNGLFHEKT